MTTPEVPVKRALVLSLMLLSLSVVGCSGSDDPVGVSERFIQALENKDLETIKALGCSENMDRYLAFVDRLISHDYRVDYDVDCSLESKDDDSASVRVKGGFDFYGLNKDGSPSSREVDNSVNLVREDGQWKYCIRQ